MKLKDLSVKEDIRKKMINSILVILFALSTSLMGATIYVNSSSGDDNSGDGSSGSPYKTFHKGYTEASSDDIIDLTGTFTWTDAAESGDAATTGYTIAKNLTIQGQGAGATYIQAASTENSADRRVFTITDTPSITAFTIKGVTIRYGVNSAEDEISAGILIYMASTSSSYHDIDVNVNECSFEDNNITGFSSSNSFSGAGLAHTGYGTNLRSNITIDKTTFKNNEAYVRSYGAGGLYITQGNNAVITNCTFEGNSGTSNYSGLYYGTSGALYVYRSGTTTITNCTFSNNSSDGNGGAIVLHSNTAHLTNNTIAGNSVSSAGKGGGILINSVTNIYLKNNLIANNLVNGSADDFYYDGSNTVTDNGYNIVETSTGYTFSGTGDITGNQTNLWGTGVSATPSLANNSTVNGTQTLALSSGSVGIDAGNNTANGSVTPPSTDQRGVSRSGATDIGAYEYAGVF